MKYFYSLLICAFSLSILSAQTIETRPLVTKRTATWCPNCGSWGWEAMIQLVEKASDEGKALVIAVHHSGSLVNDLNGAFDDVIGGNYQPEFKVNKEQQSISSSNVTVGVDNMIERINEINMQIPDFDIGIDSYGYREIGEEEIQFEINLSISPNGSPAGEYTLGAYLVRDDVAATQSGQSGAVIHKKILTKCFSSDNFGEILDVAGGNFTFTLNHATSIDVQKTQIALIIWKNEDGEKSIVNTNYTQSGIGIITSIESPEAGLDYALFQNQNGDVVLESNDYEKATILVYDFQGRLIHSSQFGNRSKHVISGSIFNSNSNYVVVLQDETKRLSKQIFIR